MFQFSLGIGIGWTSKCNCDTYNTLTEVATHEGFQGYNTLTIWYINHLLSHVIPHMTPHYCACV